MESAKVLLTLNLTSFLHLKSSFHPPLGNQAEGEWNPHGGTAFPASCLADLCLWQAAFLFIGVSNSWAHFFRLQVWSAPKSVFSHGPVCGLPFPTVS